MGAESPLADSRQTPRADQCLHQSCGAGSQDQIFAHLKKFIRTVPQNPLQEASVRMDMLPALAGKGVAEGRLNCKAVQADACQRGGGEG
ncbi:hypothetical protein D3C75_997000 [compost metagenome]